ncbi:MAG: antibiotic biosynthesis monooxygenase [Chlorobium sp.]|nr:MAG: antibiotic biosynthesis monooxygenase [Chlorobium sp.]
MSKLIVVAKVVAKEDAVQQLKSELQKLIAPTRKEEGCLDYVLHQDNEDSLVFLFYETWESAAALERHFQSDHYQAFGKIAAGLVAEKAVYQMTRIE